LKAIYSTKTVHPRDRVDFWHDVVCRTVVDRDCTPACRTTFQAELQLSTLADMHVIEYQNSAVEVRHTARHAARADHQLMVYRQTAGALKFDQDDGEVTVALGDLLVVDPCVPYTANFCDGSKSLVLKVPRRALEDRFGSLRHIIARPIKPTQSAVGLTSAFLAMLPDHVDGISSATAQLVRDQVLDLVCASIAEATSNQRFRGTSARSIVLARLRSVVDSRLADPELDPQSVAAAAGISVRYANSVLASEGMSLMRLIQSKRLARCRKAFDDPLQVHRTISEIAYAWGYNDMTHFGRSFREAYGMLPREYRRDRLALHE
jgi:AraC family transcriptional regulator, positive regulator of tynA and feaB